MKPRLKRYVHVAPTENGVYLRSWTSEVELKGKDLYRWLEQMIPHLNGEQTLDQIVEKLSEEQAQFVRNFVDILVQKKFVVDVQHDAYVELEEQEQQLYRQTLLFLQDQSANGKQLFQNFRKTRLLVVGSGQAFKAFVRSMLQMGLKHSYLLAESEYTRDVTDTVIKQVRERDAQINPTWINSVSLQTVIAEIHLAYMVYVSDEWNADHVQNWITLSREQKIPLLIATAQEGLGIVGPFMDSQARTCPFCVVDRLHRTKQQQEQASFSLTFFMMIGNVAALELFKQINGLSFVQVRDQIVILDPTSLTTSVHPLFPSPLCGTHHEHQNGWEQKMSAFYEREKISDADFVEKIEPLRDPYTGILSDVHPHDIWQVPLAHIEGNLHLPKRTGQPAQRFVVGGKNLDEATVRLFSQALLGYAQGISTQGRTIDSSVSPGMIWAWASGQTYEEVKGNGLLAACRQVVLHQGSQIVWIPLDFTSITEQEPALHIKLLRLRYELELELFAVEMPSKSVHMLVFFYHHSFFVEGMGRTQAEALDALLVAALSRAQLEQHHPDRIELSSHFVWSYPAEIKERIALQQPESMPPWMDWNEQVLDDLNNQNMKVTFSIWNEDPSLLDCGVCIGRVGLLVKRKQVVAR